MNTNEIIKSIAIPETDMWHCYDTLKNLINNNETFKNIIIEGINARKIFGFSEDLWKKLDNQNLRARGVDSFLEVLKDGCNQGCCTVAAKQVSYSFNYCFICGGELPLLKGTINCPEGAHTWIEKDEWIIDTTLMLFIHKSLKELIGYIEENRYDPEIDPIYICAKDFTNDPYIQKHKR